LLRAIAELKAGETVAPKRTNESISPVAAHEAAERRHVTVMFCDLVGSTSISAKLDAEDWRDLVGTYLKPAR
jgi:class 3 adenylate cyclase